MITTNKNLRRRTSHAALAAIMLAAASSSALAAGGGEEEDDSAPGKSEACAFIGCGGGSRVCGTASGKITSGAPPFVGEVSVSWTCYEGPLA